MAIKGCSRQMIVLNSTGSSMFEAAYFIVKPDAASRPRAHSDMLREANRIVEENSFPACSGRRFKDFWRRGGLLLFSAGAMLGGVLVGILWLLVSLAGG